MNRLPDEMLWMIFDNLTTQELRAGPARVCRRWAQLLYTRFVNVQHRSDLQRLITHPGSLVALQISTHVDFLHRLFWALLKLCPKLREITVHGCTPLSENHLQMLSLFPELDHVDVFRAGGSVDAELLSAVSPRVRSLVLNDRVCHGRLAALAATAKRLRALHLYGRAQYVPMLEVHAVLRARRDHLRELTLRCMELTDKSATLLAECPNLAVLRLYSCWRFTYKGVNNFTKLKRLTKLHVTGLKMVHRHNMGRWLSHMHQRLIELNLSSTAFCDGHASIIVQQFPELKILELWKCDWLTFEGILHLVKGLPTLRNLDLNSNLTDSQIQEIADNSSIEELRCTPTASASSTSEKVYAAVSEMDFDSEMSDSASETSTDYGDLSDTSMDLSEPIKTAQEKCMIWNVGNVRVQNCTAKFARKYFRGTGEGFRANLFYYSLVDMPLDPLLTDDGQPCEDIY